MDKGFVRPREVGNIIAILTIGLCVPFLQPLLLGGLLSEGRLTATQIGEAAMTEGLGMALAAGLAGAYLRTKHLRLVTALAAIAMAATNFATPFFHAEGVIVLRGVNGLISGIYLWLMVGIMTRTPNPGRNYAIYMAAESAFSLLLSIVFGWTLPTLGVSSSYMMLAALDLCILALIPGIPDQFKKAATAAGQEMVTAAKRWPTITGAIGLIAVGCQIGGIMALWVYVVPLGAELGHSPAIVNYAISVSIAVQIAGSLFAAVFANKVSSILATVVGTIGCIVAIVAILVMRSDTEFFVALALFTFFWKFVPIFNLPMLALFDPSNRTAMFLGSAQLLGVSAGPLIAAMTVGNGAIHNAGYVAIGLCLLSAVLAIACASRARQSLAFQTGAPACSI